MQLHPTLLGKLTYDIRSDRSIRQRFSIRPLVRPGDGRDVHRLRDSARMKLTAFSLSKARSDPKTLADGPDRTDVVRTLAKQRRMKLHRRLVVTANVTLSSALDVAWQPCRWSTVLDQLEESHGGGYHAVTLWCRMNGR